MTSWLVWNAGLLVAISSIGAVGGGINNLINKQKVEIPEEIIVLVEKPKTLTETIPDVPQKQTPATGVRTSGFCRMLRWSLPHHTLKDEEKCKKRLEIRLGRSSRTTNINQNNRS
ncbi:hypothetical protein A6V39_01135 [Candidatus Mycoplasma haematobovis]|uniref:Uncharacterized protein n=1 Tax=Candidatus Mycoplasma haematobovis TaxID=432608 RepID=A0A1A9QDW1_9MOLU|nr:hypothetical protein [Candidatus Mycoplasma haematobovis]OAL10657.1 hypothetical protein A6V39_01135 [Candidatus Mycoplasma haematobovis]